MKRKVAAGGVVIRQHKDTKQAILVLQSNHKGWCFPKGHIEPGESLEETALREVEEETGIKGRIIVPLPETSYRFISSKGNKIDKTVYWYLMRYHKKGVQTHAHEIDEVKWIPLEKIEKLLDFKEDRVLFNNALKAIKKHF